MKLQELNCEIQLDGSQGEGGGQILRSALSLSAITGKSFRLRNIRSGRKRPGLMRQHLTCVQAAAEICRARIPEVELGSTELMFRPFQIRSVSKEYSIGTAGSTTLLAQTLIPILLHAPEPSEIVLRGGTHVKSAPGYEYFSEVYLGLLTGMGAKISANIGAYGFFPAGGGEVFLRIEPSDLQPCQWHERSEVYYLGGEILMTPSIPKQVAEKEIAKLTKSLTFSDEKDTWIRTIHHSASPGNVIVIRALPNGKNSAPSTLTSAYGERGKRAEQVAKEAVWEMQRFLNSPAPIDEYLADQLLLPLALAGGGGFTASALTPHFYSNRQVIESFLDVRIRTEKLDRFAHRVVIGS